MQRDREPTAQVSTGNRAHVHKRLVRASMSFALAALSVFAINAVASASTPTVSTQQFGSTVLTSVGCLGDGTCIAFDSGVRGDVYVMSNANWAQGPSLPNDQYGLQIWPEQISCSQDETCTVIGNDQQSIVSEVWQNGSWQTPVIADYRAPDNDNFHFQSISCYSVGNCLAVGWFPKGQLDESFGIQEVNGVWQTPVADQKYVEQYESVSCWSASDCEVAGFVLNPDYAGSAGSTVWPVSDGQWGAPSTIYQSGWLTSISCPASGACVAVGSSELTKGGADAFPIESTLSSGAWSTPSEPDLENIDLGSWYTSVSCMDVGDCLAVGVTYGETDGFYSIFQNGQWATPAATVPMNESASIDSDLFGSSCSSNGFCVGTGQYIPEGDESGLAVMVTFEAQPVTTSKPVLHPVLKLVHKGKIRTGTVLVARVSDIPSGSILHFRWIKDGGAISHATKSSLTITPNLSGHILWLEVTISCPGYATISKKSAYIAG